MKILIDRKDAPMLSVDEIVKHRPVKPAEEPKHQALVGTNNVTETLHVAERRSLRIGMPWEIRTF